MSFPEELYSSTFSTPGRTYFFDVKKRHGESRRLVLTCSKMQGGMRIRDRLAIVEEDVAEFVAKLLEAVGSMAVAEPRVPKSDARELPPRATHAYEPWTPELDTELLDAHVAGSSTATVDNESVERR